jgi:hypothetical protein
MTKIYVVTDTKKGIIGSYHSEEQALKAIEQYEKDFWASADTYSEYVDEYPNGEISFGEFLVKIDDYKIEEILYYGDGE